jgi:hypothetical protein
MSFIKKLCQKLELIKKIYDPIIQSAELSKLLDIFKGTQYILTKIIINDIYVFWYIDSELAFSAYIKIKKYIINEGIYSIDLVLVKAIKGFNDFEKACCDIYQINNEEAPKQKITELILIEYNNGL